MRKNMYSITDLRKRQGSCCQEIRTNPPVTSGRNTRPNAGRGHRTQQEAERCPFLTAWFPCLQKSLWLRLSRLFVTQQYSGIQKLFESKGSDLLRRHCVLGSSGVSVLEWVAWKMQYIDVNTNQWWNPILMAVFLLLQLQKGVCGNPPTAHTSTFCWLLQLASPGSLALCLWWSSANGKHRQESAGWTETEIKALFPWAPSLWVCGLHTPPKATAPLLQLSSHWVLGPLPSSYPFRMCGLPDLS